VKKYGSWRSYGVNKIAQPKFSGERRWAAEQNKPVMLHIDINSYFATLLQQETPALRHKPVVVVKDLGRTCVIAASKEAKIQGISTGCSLAEAYQLAPDLIEMPAEFEMYWSATKRLKDLFESFSPAVEIFSLDEVFINYTPVQNLYLSPHSFALQIQAAIKNTLGEWVTCNIGIAENRFLAKMMGETAPKGSVSQVTACNKTILLATTSFADVCGVGLHLAKRLDRIGVTVPYQINFVPNHILQQIFGPFWSVELRKMGRGEEPLFLQRLADVPPHMKSVSRSITGYKLSANQQLIIATLYNLSEEVIQKLRKMELAGRLVFCSLAGDNQYWGDHITLYHYVRHVHDMFGLIRHTLYPRWHHKFPVIRLRVGMSLLRPWSKVQDCWFPDWWRQERISKAIDELTSRYGLFTVTSGLLLRKEKIRPEVTGFLGDKKFHFG